MAMHSDNFGTLLREARERRRLSLAEVAARTRVSQGSLKLLEAGNIDDLPAHVFVRGFIRSYARSVGIADDEPLGLFEQALASRRRREEVAASTPSPQHAEGEGVAGEEDVLGPRRGIGLAVFVIIVLLIATISLSLFLRQPPQSGEGLSQGQPGPAPIVLRSADPGTGC